MTAAAPEGDRSHRGEAWWKQDFPSKRRQPRHRRQVRKPRGVRQGEHRSVGAGEKLRTGKRAGRGAVRETYHNVMMAKRLFRRKKRRRARERRKRLCPLVGVGLRRKSGIERSLLGSHLHDRSVSVPVQTIPHRELGRVYIHRNAAAR